MNKARLKGLVVCVLFGLVSPCHQSSELEFLFPVLRGHSALYRAHYTGASSNSILCGSVSQGLHVKGYSVVDVYGSSVFENKTRTSKVGAISKAQKAQNIFLEKNFENFEKFFSFGKCRTVPKNVKGGPFFDL